MFYYYNYLKSLYSNTPKGKTFYTVEGVSVWLSESFHEQLFTESLPSKSYRIWCTKLIYTYFDTKNSMYTLVGVMK